MIGSFQLLEFTDSTDFCGRLCHEVMYPEFTAYQASPHAQVPCADCHVGFGADYWVKSKITGTPLIFATLFNTFDRPVQTPVEDLRPARETCEQCHWPAKFSGDLVRFHVSYAADENNTKRVDTRALRVGSGEYKTARDIHWHIAAKVWYLPLDKKRQDIGWVGVEEKNGNLVEYVNPSKATEVTSQRIATEKRLMDCIDCHNRATHIFRSPNELIDVALAQGKIDSSLPFIKSEALKALDPPNPSLDQAMTKMESVKEFYRASYPEIYEKKGKAVDEAITELKEIAKLTTFPDMKVTWKTHSSKIGHQESEGCFRCHGKLIAKTGDDKDKTLDAGCESCHYNIVSPK